MGFTSGKFPTTDPIPAGQEEQVDTVLVWGDIASECERDGTTLAERLCQADKDPWAYEYHDLRDEIGLLHRHLQQFGAGYTEKPLPTVDSQPCKLSKMQAQMLRQLAELQEAGAAMLKEHEALEESEAEMDNQFPLMRGRSSSFVTACGS